MRKIDPDLLAELYEALDRMEATSRELARQKRALFPAIAARRKAVECVRAVWKECRGRKADPPPRPILDAIAAAAKAAPADGEALPRLRGRKAYRAAKEEMGGAAAPDAARMRRRAQKGGQTS